MTVSIVMTGTARSCTLTSGSPSMVVSSATGLVVGATIQGTGIPTGTRIASISGTTVTMENGSGAPVNATVGGAQNLIFSSVYGSTLTISMSASGDTANMDTIFNAGFGVKQRGLATREILFPGGLYLLFTNIVAGAVFDFQNWTVECGNTGYLQWDQSTILGEIRGGYLVNGTQFIKSSGPTIIANNFRNGAAGGTNLFVGTATGSMTGLFRMNNLRVVYQSGNNAAPFFSTGRMNCAVDNMILDYQAGSGPNAGIGASYGYLKNTVIVKANSGIGNPNNGIYATIEGLEYSGIYTDSPNHKFSIPNGYVLEGYAPQVLSSQTLGGFQNNTVETFANINLASAGWGLNDLKTKQFRFGGGNVLHFPRRVAFEFNDSNAVALTGVTLFIKSGSTTVVNAVLTGDYSANTQALVLTWTNIVNSYRVAESILDTISQFARVRKYGYIEQQTTYSLDFADYSQPFFMLSDVALSTIDDATANAISTVEVDFPNKLIKITGVASLRQSYAKCQVELAKPANSDVANFIVTDGDSVNVFGGWTYQIGASGVLNASTTLKQFKVTGEEVAVVSGGVVNVPYQDVDGLRVTVTNLDPEGFGITWFLRHRLTGGSTWTNVSGTGNTALILLSEGTYDVQVRAPGYEWESALVLDTSVSLALNAGLRYHVSANNTPQYEMAFDNTLSDIFQFDAVAEKVSVSNSTTGILSPGFAELYRATQRIQHIPALVWTWVSPVTANSTSQKILIPTGNPISMFLTDASTNSVKITCPVIHADTGQSADDRVRGNASGYSIILGSPATAESAGLASQIISGLGGANYDVGTHSLVAIKALEDQVKTLTEAIKTKVDTNLDAKVSTRSTLTTQDIPAGITAAQVWSHGTRTLQKSGFGPNGWFVFEDTPPDVTSLVIVRASGSVNASSFVGGPLVFAFADNPSVTRSTPVVTSVEEVTSTKYRCNFASGTADVFYANMVMQGATYSDYVATSEQIVAQNLEIAAIKSDAAAALKSSDYTAPDNTKIAQIKTKVDTLNNTDVSGVPAAVRAELETELGRIDVAVSTRSTLTAEDVPEGLTAAEVWSAATRTLTEAPGLTTGQAEQLRKVAQLHGVGVDLVVTETTRTAGDVSQTLTTDDDGNTTVSAS